LGVFSQKIEIIEMRWGESVIASDASEYFLAEPRLIVVSSL